VPMDRSGLFASHRQFDQTTDESDTSMMGSIPTNQLIDRSGRSEYILGKNECVISDDKSSVYTVVAGLCLWQVCTCDSVIASIKLLGFITPLLLDLHRPLLSPHAPISCSPGPCLLALHHVTAWLSLQIVRKPLHSCERTLSSPNSPKLSSLHQPSILFTKPHPTSDSKTERAKPPSRHVPILRGVLRRLQPSQAFQRA